MEHAWDLKYVVDIVQCRVQYGEYIPSYFTYFRSLYAIEIIAKYEKQEHNCQYCTMKRAITSLSLHACWNQIYQELAYLQYKWVLTYYKWVEAKTAINNFT